MGGDECPYCGKEVEICHDDGYGLTEDEIFTATCNWCDKEFAYTVCIDITHTLHKADCLNGTEHKFLPTKTYPKRFIKMRCEDCGEERELTPEERQVIVGEE
jgi:hypothetical protein